VIKIEPTGWLIVRDIVPVLFDGPTGLRSRFRPPTTHSRTMTQVEGTSDPITTPEPGQSGGSLASRQSTNLLSVRLNV
jgi:hypothetical protein